MIWLHTHSTLKLDIAFKILPLATGHGFFAVISPSLLMSYEWPTESDLVFVVIVTFDTEHNEAVDIDV